MPAGADSPGPGLTSDGARASVTRERLAGILEGINEQCFALDRDWRFTYVNRRGEEFLGRSREQLLGRSLWDEFPPSIGLSMRRQYQRAVKEQTPIAFEAPSEMVAGNWLEIRAYPADDGLTILCQDITQRKLAEEALRRSEERFRALIENASDLITVIDADGGILYESPPVERVLGYRPEELIGKSVFEFLHPDEAEATRRELAELVATPRASMMADLRFRHRDGSWRILEVVATNLLNDPAVGGVIVNSRDITAYLQAEEIRRAREAAERANRAKSEFLSRMSHELRTPMNAILGFGQLLAADELASEQKEGVEQILRAGNHLLGLIDEVLDISRIEMGRLQLTPEALDVREVLDEAIGLVRPLAVQRRIQIEVDLADTIGHALLADRQRLKQVLLNLLSNAITYNREGGRVTVVGGPGAEARLRISVNDTGHGISSEQMHRLFSPFDRLGAEGLGVEGTGLGLALSKSLVEAMSGTIGVESTPGVGSTFWIELPLAGEPDELETGQAPPQVAPEGVAITEGKTRVVLCIEDNISNLKLVERILARCRDVELIPALQGRLGLDLARTHRPDLILLDLNLPDISGQEVLLRLRQDERLREIPVVIVSADAIPQQVDALLASGARAYITKPYDVSRFREVVFENLPGRTGAAEGVAEPKHP